MLSVVKTFTKMFSFFSPGAYFNNIVELPSKFLLKDVFFKAYFIHYWRTQNPSLDNNKINHVITIA